MTAQNRAVIWIAGGAGLLWLLYVLSGILLPFVVGMTVAFLFDPLADRLEKLGLSRVMATAVITAGFFFILGLGIVLLLPVIISEVRAFAGAMPEYLIRAQELLNAPALERVRQIIAPVTNGGVSAEQFSGVAGDVAAWLGGVLARVVSGGFALFNILSLVFLTPIISFYFLMDWDRMIARIDSMLPLQYAAVIRNLANETNDVLAGFIRGQMIVCVALAGFYGLGLTLSGLKFGLIAGMIAGAFTFVPFLGSLIGLTLSLGLAIVQYWPALSPIGVIVAIFVAGQILEGNFLTPRLVGARVRLHPLWITFALLSFGLLMGFTGVLLAVPVAAIMGVLVRHFVQVYLHSPLYHGGDAAAMQALGGRADDRATDI